MSTPPQTGVLGRADNNQRTPPPVEDDAHSQDGGSNDSGPASNGLADDVKLLFGVNDDEKETEEFDAAEPPPPTDLAHRLLEKLGHLAKTFHLSAKADDLVAMGLEGAYAEIPPHILEWVHSDDALHKHKLTPTSLFVAIKLLQTTKTRRDQQDEQMCTEFLLSVLGDDATNDEVLAGNLPATAPRQRPPSAQPTTSGAAASPSRQPTSETETATPNTQPCATVGIQKSALSTGGGLSIGKLKTSPSDNLIKRAKSFVKSVLSHKGDENTQKEYDNLLTCAVDSYGLSPSQGGRDTLHRASTDGVFDITGNGSELVTRTLGDEPGSTATPTAAQTQTPFVRLGTNPTKALRREAFKKEVRHLAIGGPGLPIGTRTQKNGVTERVITLSPAKRNRGTWVDLLEKKRPIISGQSQASDSFSAALSAITDKRKGGGSDNGSESGVSSGASSGAPPSNKGGTFDDNEDDVPDDDEDDEDGDY
jgi:hypothetical protein